MFSKRFWQLASERAIKSFAQSFAAVLSASGLGLLEAPWPKALSTAAMVAVLSLLTSVASTKVGAADDPSTIDTDGPSGSAKPSEPAPPVMPAVA